MASGVLWTKSLVVLVRRLVAAVLVARYALCVLALGCGVHR